MEPVYYVASMKVTMKRTVTIAFTEYGDSDPRAQEWAGSVDVYDESILMASSMVEKDWRGEDLYKGIEAALRPFRWPVCHALVGVRPKKN